MISLVEQFIENSSNYWAAISSGSSKQANAHLRKNDKLIKGYIANGELGATLVPLLEDHRPFVQHAAAAYLLVNNEKCEEAIRALERLAKNDATLIGAAANATLRLHSSANREN